MTRLTLVEKLANKSANISTKGKSANDGSYRVSLSIVYDLIDMAEALHIKINKDDLQYYVLPETIEETNKDEITYGQTSSRFLLLASLFDYAGYLTSLSEKRITSKNSYSTISFPEHVVEHRKNYIEKIRLIAVLQKYVNKLYTKKKARIIKHIKNIHFLSEERKSYLLKLLSVYNLNQLDQAKADLIIKLLSSIHTPSMSKSKALEIAKYQV